MAVPDVLGFEFEAAVEVLAQQGWTFSVLTTHPPRRACLSAERTRVVRVRQTGERTVELVVAHEGMGEGCPKREPT